jgi:hypothetical protein
MSPNFKTIYQLVENGINTSRKIAMLNPLDLRAIRLTASYGRYLKILCDNGFLDREYKPIDDPVCTGAEYVYSIRTLQPVVLGKDQYLVI